MNQPEKVEPILDTKVRSNLVWKVNITIKVMPLSISLQEFHYKAFLPFSF
jgi:hypothetical protein